MGAPRSQNRGGGNPAPTRPPAGGRAGALGKARRAAWVAALLAVVLVFAQLPLAASADHTPEHVFQKIQELERAIQISRQNAARYREISQQYQGAVAAANARIAELAAKQDTLESEAEQVANEVAIAEEQLSLATLQLNETTAYVSSLAAAIEEGTKLLARREDLYAQHLRHLYRQSRITPLEMLLSSSSLADFAERVQLVMLILRADQQLATDIKRLRASNEDKRFTADLKLQEIEGLKGQISAQRDQLLAEKARLDAVLSETQLSRYETAASRAAAAANAAAAQHAARNLQLQAADLERRKQAAEALYAQLAAQLQGSSGITTPWAGKLATWPLSGPITSYFGPRRGGFHNGLDIAAPMYTPIRAAQAGRVQVVGKPYLAGGDTATVVLIAHASNMSTLYGHVDDGPRRPVVAAGQWVNAGQVIAYVGMTGWTTGPHLHFMTIFNAQATNPLRFLP